MELWVIQEGEKAGPFNDYEIRARIESGELGADTRVWHEGADGWTKLSEVEIFRSEFAPRAEIAAAPAEVPPPLPNAPRPFLRFLARWFDHNLYLLALFGLMRIFGIDLVAALSSSTFLFLYLLPWVVLEAIAVHQWKTTPGKRLLGLQVQHPDGGSLELGTSLARAFRVFVLGMGMKMPIVTQITHGFGIWFLLKFGETPWDKMGRCEVRHTGWTPGGIAWFVVGGLLVIMALSVVMLPVTIAMWEQMREVNPQLPDLFSEGRDSGA